MFLLLKTKKFRKLPTEGIEPPYPDYKTGALPLNEAGIRKHK